jgi:hypothetical protein
MTKPINIIVQLAGKGVWAIPAPAIRFHDAPPPPRLLFLNCNPRLTRRQGLSKKLYGLRRLQKRDEEMLDKCGCDGCSSLSELIDKLGRDGCRRAPELGSTNDKWN